MLLTSIISLILFSGPTEAHSTPDGQDYREANLVFRWDKSNYEDNYLGNSEAADKLLNLLQEVGVENVDSVSVVAYASPEGVYEHNLKLSRNRAREFDAAVRARIGLQQKYIPIRVTPGGEAWDLLRLRVEADSTVSDAARTRILKLLDDDSVPRDTKKWRMAHNSLGNTPQEGDVYHWLLLSHYRYLRCLAIKIYVREAPEPIQEVQEAQGPEPEQGTVSGTEQGAAPSETTQETPEVTPEVSPRENMVPEIPEEPAASRRGTPIIGISTNLIYDATWIPNYGFTSVPSFSLEYYPAGGRWTFGADVDWSHWRHYDTHRFNQIHNITLHARRYFSSGEEGFRGLYLKGSLNAVQYGLGWDEHGWEGEGAGISAGIGHKWNWGAFFLDTGIDMGFLYSRLDPYTWGNDATGWYYYDYSGAPEDFVTRRKAFTWFGPTRAYISIGLDLFKRKK